MIIYSDETLRDYGVLREKQIVLPLGTRGYTVTNISNVNIGIATDKVGPVTTLIPYFSQTLAGNKGDTITITPGALSLDALPVEAMSLAMDFSQVSVTPALIPLAPLQAYVMNAAITGDVTVTAGTVEVINTPGGALNIGGEITVGNTSLLVENTAGGTLNVAGAMTVENTPAVTIANTVVANIAAGNVDATITNANIPVTGDVTATIANASIPVTGAVDATITNASMAVTGDVNVGTMPAVTIDNAVLPISGDVNVGTMPAVTIENAVLPVSGDVVAIAVAGAVDATITNASIPVTGDVNATITNASMAVTGDVNVGTMPAVTIDNAVLPISGSVNANITAGTVDVGTMPSVTIATGTVEVTQPVDGVLNVGGEITVGNTALQVENTVGGTVNVAGAVTVENTPNVNIANTVNANITSGVVEATITNALVNTELMNAVIPTTPVLVSLPVTQAITMAANGGRAQVVVPVPLNMYNAFILRVSSAGNQIASYSFGYTDLLLQAYGEIAVTNENAAVIRMASNTTDSYFYSDTNYFVNMKLIGPALSEFLFDAITVNITNLSAAIINDTVTVQLFMKSEMATIKTAASVPIYAQPPAAVLTTGIVNDLNAITPILAADSTKKLLKISLYGFLFGQTKPGKISCLTDGSSMLGVVGIPVNSDLYVPLVIDFSPHGVPMTQELELIISSGGATVGQCYYTITTGVI